MADKIIHVCSYPGSFLFSLSWAWETRKTNRKPWLERFADAMDDAQDVF